jgi:hypothetical protein
MDVFTRRAMPPAVDASDARANLAGDAAPSPKRGTGRARSRSIRLFRVTRREARQAEERALALEAEFDDGRPRRREDCVDGPRPCPHVSCRHHLYLDVNPQTGTIKLNFPELEVWELEHSCALDVADQGGAPIETVGQFMNVTRERIRQIETQALSKLEGTPSTRELADFELL